MPSRLLRAALRLGPRSWRERYGDEILALADDIGSGPRDLFDVTRVALRERIRRTAGGDPMRPRANPWMAAAAAVAAVLIATPAAAFVLLNLFPRQIEWLSGVRMPLGVGVAPGLEWLVPALPLAAVAVAAAPAVRLGIRRDTVAGGLTVTVRTRTVPRWLLVVAAACALLLAVVVGYGVSENLLEALR